MNLIPETLIDTHFSQRGRHGRLLTAMAHYPQDIGLGIDERTALVARDHEFRVIGEGAVTVMDGANMKHNDLPYHGRDEPVGMFSVCIHVLPRGYRFDLKTRTPQAPQMHKLAGVDSDV
jgi:cyanophycinase